MDDIKKADEEIQIEIMENWFLDNFEDPAENTPFESREGGYIYIWGGPYDAKEELENMFSGIVPDELIGEVADELSDTCYEWAGKIDSNHFDDYYLSVVASNTAFHETFGNSINNIKSLLTVAVGEDLKQQYLRLLHINIIATLETFLSDAFINTVLNNEVLVRKFVETNPDFSQRKLNLNELFERYDNIYNEIKLYLLDMIWHNLAKIQPMYKETLGIEFQKDKKDIYKAIMTRHDLVHRNGKTKDGTEINVEEPDITTLIDIVSDFVNAIDAQFDEAKF